MFVLYDQKMYANDSDCIVRTVVHGLAVLWKKLIWFQASVTKLTKFYSAQLCNLPSGVIRNFISRPSSSPALQGIL